MEWSVHEGQIYIESKMEFGEIGTSIVENPGDFTWLDLDILYNDSIVDCAEVGWLEGVINHAEPSSVSFAGKGRTEDDCCGDVARSRLWAAMLCLHWVNGHLTTTSEHQ